MRIDCYTKNKNFGFFHIYIGKRRFLNYSYTLVYNFKPFKLHLYEVNDFDDYKTIFKIK